MQFTARHVMGGIFYPQYMHCPDGLVVLMRLTTICVIHIMLLCVSEAVKIKNDAV